ncbi:MAG: ZinT/AdcA family metal-binding protein [Tissierellia bacterium]|nr:ZinT/AdcA family metal-binding protein [Tissierellia bacterium]
MFKKVFIAGSLALALLLAGCQPAEEKKEEPQKVEETEKVETTEKQEEKEPEKEEVEKEEEKEAEKEEAAEEVSLADWDGTWNNMGAYLNDEELQDSFKELAEKEGNTPEEAKAAYEKKRMCEFDGLVIEGNQIKFLDGFQDKGGNAVSEAEYEYTATHQVKHGNFDIEWFVFTAKEADAKYPVLLMMPVHGEEALTHFHMRYGDDEQKLLEEEGWYPTFVKPSSTYDQLKEEITE